MDKLVNILGVRFSTVNSDIINKKLWRILSGNNNATVFTPNAEILYEASKDMNFSKVLNSATLLIPDGIGIYLASVFLGSPFGNRFTGIGIAEQILSIAAGSGLRVFLLGATEGVAEKAAAELCLHYEGLCICGTHHGYFDKSTDSEENTRVLRKIKDSEADVVFVCFGSPVQEKWIFDNAKNLPRVRLFMGLGGSLDVWSKKLSRAPRLFQALGLEWLWRLICEPKRILRFPRLVFFALRVIKQALC